MDIKIKAWLYDFLNAINEIELFLGDTTDFSLYQNDLRTKRAIERNLEIIGEAMSRVLNQDDTLQLSNS